MAVIVASCIFTFSEDIKMMVEMCHVWFGQRLGVFLKYGKTNLSARHLKDHCSTHTVINDEHAYCMLL